jgi:hypothetical protein
LKQCIMKPYITKDIVTSTGLWRECHRPDRVVLIIWLEIALTVTFQGLSLLLSIA